MERVVLTPKQAAAQIGVSESSLRRWCDQGRLVSTRTPGGHRRIELGALVEFARQNGFRVANGATEQTHSRGGRKVDEASLAGDLYKCLVRGNDLALRRIISDAIGDGHSLAAICDRLLAPALGRIGRDWSQGILDVYEEHRATQLVLDLLSNARELTPTPEDSAPVALCSSLGSNIHSVATVMSALVLREAGWKSINLGANTPVESICRALDEVRPSLLAVSVSYLSDPDVLLKDYRTMHGHAARCGAGLAVGGRALTQDLRRQMTVDFFGDTMVHLASFAVRLRQTLTNRPLGGPPTMNQ